MAWGGGHQQRWGTVSAAPSHLLLGTFRLRLPPSPTHPALRVSNSVPHPCPWLQPRAGRAGGSARCRSPPRAAPSWAWAELTETPLLNQHEQQLPPARTRVMGWSAGASHPWGAHPELPWLNAAPKPAGKNVFSQIINETGPRHPRMLQKPNPQTLPRQGGFVPQRLLKSQPSLTSALGCSMPRTHGCCSPRLAPSHLGSPQGSRTLPRLSWMPSERL